MKKIISHPIIRKQLEYLNLGIGVMLILISMVYLFRAEIDYFASWFIFGCMYMVMDKYWECDMCSTRRIKMDVLKYCINLSAFVVSIGFFLYIL